MTHFAYNNDGTSDPNSPEIEEPWKAPREELVIRDFRKYSMAEMNLALFINCVMPRNLRGKQTRIKVIISKSCLLRGLNEMRHLTCDIARVQPHLYQPIPLLLLFLLLSPQPFRREHLPLAGDFPILEFFWSTKILHRLQLYQAILGGVFPVELERGRQRDWWVRDDSCGVYSDGDSSGVGDKAGVSYEQHGDRFCWRCAALEDA